MRQVNNYPQDKETKRYQTHSHTHAILPRTKLLEYNNATLHRPTPQQQTAEHRKKQTIEQRRKKKQARALASS